MTTEQTFEKMLKQNGVLVYKTRGVSMRPLLKQDRDLVTVRPVTGRLKKYDVPLYKRKHDGKYVLHRIIAVHEKDYVIRGDNTYVKEYGITDDDIIGVLTDFQRKKKNYSVEMRGYKIYSRVWNFIYPMRFVLHAVERFLAKIKRKMIGGGKQ